MMLIQMMLIFPFLEQTVFKYRCGRQIKIPNEFIVMIVLLFSQFAHTRHTAADSAPDAAI